MDKYVYIVSAYPDSVDSVWDNEADAEQRVADLIPEYGPYGSVHKFKLNDKEGWDC